MPLRDGRGRQIGRAQVRADGHRGVRDGPIERRHDIEGHDTVEQLVGGADGVGVGRLGAVGHHHPAADRHVGEVHDHVIALAGADGQHVRDVGPHAADRGVQGRQDRFVEQPELVSDHQDRHRGPLAGGDLAVLLEDLEAQVVEARVRTVQQPQTVLTLLHVELRPGLTVDQRHPSEELRQGGVHRHLAGRVEELAGGVELAVLDDDRHLVGGVGQHTRGAQGVLVRVPQDVEARKSHVDVGAGDAQGVVVVPEGAGLLLVLVGVGEAEQAALLEILGTLAGRRRVRGHAQIARAGGAPILRSAVAQIPRSRRRAGGPPPAPGSGRRPRPGWPSRGWCRPASGWAGGCPLASTRSLT